MLRAEDFVVLPKTEQARHVQEHGQLLHARIKGWCKIELYWLRSVRMPFGGYFVEVWLLYDLETVGLIRTFSATKGLNPYLEHIHLKLPF